MQISVDTTQESPAKLRLISKLFVDYAALAEAEDAQAAAEYPKIPQAHTHTGAPVIVGDTTLVGRAIADHKDITQVYIADGLGVDRSVLVGVTPLIKEPDPAVVFAKPAVPGGTVIPFPLPVPPIPAVTPVATPAVSGTNVSAPAAGSPVITANPTDTNVSSGGTVELDGANIPWDVRIHQASKGKKVDGTWKLKKGLDPTLAATITAELKARGLPAAVLAQTVTVPPTLPTPVPLPVAPGASASVQPVGANGPALPVANGALPLPTPPAVGGLPLSPIGRFQAMMKKISAGLAAKTITQDMVSAAHINLGMPQLQLAVTRPDMIPQIDAALGL